MAAAGHSGPRPDLYQLLGVARGATHEEIAQAWRRRARAEHPDSRPGDAAAAGRFRALAEAYRVLGDPAHRAAYDQALADARPAPGIASAATRIPVRYLRGPHGAGVRARASGPSLRAGPVLVDGAPRESSAAWDERDSRLAVLAELALWCLCRDRDWPW